ncbi:MAG: abortive phage infection protein [Clostridia bacterium]|nr:abortive phage infection protein [Clostridia bacterium]
MKKLANNKQKIIHFNKLNQYHMNRYELRTMMEKGNVYRVMRGVYADRNEDINEFWLMGERYKNGIYSHNTALYFYGMTDRTPLRFDMTFPSNNRVSNDFLKVHYVKKENHKLGLTKIKLGNGYEIQIYNVERTICDIVRDRNKIDPQTFNNAMKEYMKRKDKNLKLLYEYATAFRVNKVLERYMEVLS